jgi:hypothetical protein
MTTAAAFTGAGLAFIGVVVNCVSDEPHPAI